jgi:hypothetical protein
MKTEKTLRLLLDCSGYTRAPFTGERSTFRLFVQSHPPPSLHQRSLSRRVCGFEPVSQNLVLRAGEPVRSVSLQCSELPYQT